MLIANSAEMSNIYGVMQFCKSFEKQNSKKHNETSDQLNILLVCRCLNFHTTKKVI